MVKHIVMLRLKDSAHGNDKLTNARLIKQKLEALRGQIPGILPLEVGLDWSATDSSADLVIYSEFESRAALDGYQGHPAHQAVLPFIAEARLRAPAGRLRRLSAGARRLNRRPSGPSMSVRRSDLTPGQVGPTFGVLQ